MNGSGHSHSSHLPWMPLRNLHRPWPVGRKEKKSQEEIKSLEYDLKCYKGWEAGWKAAAETHVKEKEELKKIAMSHEVKWPDPPQPKKIKEKIWEKRRYSDHPSANLKALQADLEAFKSQEVELSVTLQPCGGWKSVLENKQFRDRDFFKEMAFHGPPSRVGKEISNFFKDHDMPFMSRLSKTDIQEHEKGSFGELLKWNDTDSAVVMIIDLSVTRVEQPAQKPEVHIVQVPVIETRVVEIVKTVEVQVAEPPDQAQLAALVEVAIEEKLAQRALRRTPLAEGGKRASQPKQTE